MLKMDLVFWQDGLEYLKNTYYLMGTRLMTIFVLHVLFIIGYISQVPAYLFQGVCVDQEGNDSGTIV